MEDVPNRRRSLFALLYRVLPDVHLLWRDVTTGAFKTAVLFTIGQQLIGLYLGQSSVASSFDAAGSIMIPLLWVYYSCQVLLVREDQEALRQAAEEGRHAAEEARQATIAATAATADALATNLAQMQFLEDARKTVRQITTTNPRDVH